MKHHEQVPQPKTETDQSKLPSAVTFFLTAQQRTKVLQLLKQLDQNRSAALIRALNINTQ